MSAYIYERPDWDAVGEVQLLRCGKSGIRREQDRSHAAWIRREAKKRGLKAHVYLTPGGSAIVRLLRAA